MSIFYTLWRTEGRLIIPEHVINGILSSLVAITPACASVTTWAAFPIGAVGALVGLGVNTFVCHKKVDDPAGRRYWGSCRCWRVKNSARVQAANWCAVPTPCRLTNSGIAAALPWGYCPGHWYPQVPSSHRPGTPRLSSTRWC